ncbi:hypothetical protein Tco_1276780 [Tanacetum coccineum]
MPGRIMRGGVTMSASWSGSSRCTTLPGWISTSPIRHTSKEDSCIWMAFGGNIRDLGSFREETDKIRLYTKSLEEIIIQTVKTASLAIAKTSELDQDGVRIFKMVSGSSLLKRNPKSFIEVMASGILRCRRDPKQAARVAKNAEQCSEHDLQPSELSFEISN